VSNDVIRKMVREALAEEIGKLRRDGGFLPAKSPVRQIREEIVSIRSDAELAAFVARLAAILKDGRSREEVEQGRWIFRLGRPSAGGFSGAMMEQRGALPSSAAPAAPSARIDRGVISERQIEALPAETTHLVLGKSVRLTPLALDRIRLRRISITRTG
jgi:hypothetical protein